MNEKLKRERKRSSGTVWDYFERIQQGDTLAEIAERYKTTGPNVRASLARYKLPTCANEYLRWLHNKEQK